MVKRLIKLSAIILLVLMVLTACNSSAPSPQGTVSGNSSEASTPKIDNDVLGLIETSIKSATIDDVIVVCSDTEGKVRVTVALDPAVLKYQVALNLEPSVEALKEILDEYNLELDNFRFNAFFYKNGKVDYAISWDSEDLSIGDFVNANESVFKSMSLQDVFDYCEYTSGDYKKMG